MTGRADQGSRGLTTASSYSRPSRQYSCSYLPPSPSFEGLPRKRARLTSVVDEGEDRAKLARLVVAQVDRGNRLLWPRVSLILRSGGTSPAPHLGCRHQHLAEKHRVGDELLAPQMPLQVAANDLDVPAGGAVHPAERLVRQAWRRRWKRRDVWGSHVLGGSGGVDMNQTARVCQHTGLCSGERVLGDGG